MGEPISPELVSVDPELAAAARAELPEEPWRTFVPVAPEPVAEEPEPVAEEPVPVAEEPVPAAEEPVEVGRPRRLRRTAIALGLVAAAAAGIAAGSSDVFTRSDDRPSFESEPSRAAASAAATTGVTAPTTKSVAGAGFTPSRTFAWVPVAGASEYRIRFSRDGRVVLEGRAKQPRFVLPRRFEFRPGAYRWTVEPRRGEAYGPPVVDSRFEVGD